MDDPVTVFTPGEAARRLGVTTQSLRRYADDYGDVFDPIPVRQRQRVFDDLIVGRLRAAQEMFRDQTAPSIRAGLERIRGGSAEPTGLDTLPNSPFEHLVLQYLQNISAEVNRLTEENAVLHDQIVELQKVRALPPAAPRVAVVSHARAEAAEKMNAYLLGELERRRLEMQTPEKRRFWR